ncbi:MAG: alanine racemase [Actinomycetota bacterium]
MKRRVLKTRQLPSDITWHFQGQIQGRKIRSIVSWADVVHSLDSLDHAQRFDSKISDKTLKFFVQVNVEPHRINRGGVPISKLSQFLENLTTVSRIAPIGLMVVAPQGSPAIDAFNQVKEAKDQLIRTFPNLCALSMGMSSDFEAAIVTGATHLRIGSSILGSRTLTA